ncbi:hypothetical protein KIPB_013102, partial [Kipferlia bialata]
VPSLGSGDRVPGVYAYRVREED